MPLPAGTRLGPYEVLAPLGAGGMGEVYRAWDASLARELAIKVLPPDVSADARRLERFEKEARAASALNHPNIVTIYEVGRAEGTAFIAMELVDGKTLRALLDGGALPLKKTLSLAAQIADGLAKAHAAGIVHRDLKPENLLVTRDGFVKIVDFGLAKLAPFGMDGPRGARSLTVSLGTEAGTILGTVGYMSPEQASGEPLDFRSDQFSFGSSLYEMITGRRAFERPTPAQTLSAIIETEPEALNTLAPKTPMNLSWVVERCLAKDPEDRYGSTKDLARDLAALRDHSSWSSATGVAPPAGRRLRFSQTALAATALAVVGLAALTYFAGRKVQATLDREAPPPKRTTLTFRRGYLTGARFAPDGHTIVYSACWDGKRSEIFTTRVGSIESRPLGIKNAGILAVSSTGEMAISIDCAGIGIPCMGMLARVPLAGGAPREILGSVFSADWSPDGKDLAVGVGSAIQYPIGKVLYQGSEIRGFVSSLRVSPDGNLVAFLDHPSRDSDRAILSVVDRTGKKKILTNEWAKAGPILWSPAGDEVFFTRWGGDERRGARLSGGTRSAAWIPGLDDVSRDGRFLDTGMLSENYRGVIRARVPDEPEERNLSWLGRSVAVDLSADGKQLLLYEEGSNPERKEEVFTTYLRPTNGSDAKRLGDGRALALSPDGQWALVVRAAPETHLVLLPVGEGEPKRLPGGGLLYRKAVFFPDGRRILYSAADNTYIQDVEGGPPRQIGKEDMFGTIVSPDGRTVTLITHEDVYFYAADGEENPRPIRGALGGDAPIRWSSDGKTIYLWAYNEEPLALYRLDLATGRRERWKQLAPPDMTGFLRYGSRIAGPGLTITPDGRYYAYTYFTDQSRLVLTDAGPDWWK